MSPEGLGGLCIWSAMLDPDLISSRIYQASPDGRLAGLEAILRRMLDDGEDVSAHYFNKYVAWAREARNQQKMADMVRYIAKAEGALMLTKLGYHSPG